MFGEFGFCLGEKIKDFLFDFFFEGGGVDKQNRPKVSRASLWLELGAKISGISLWNPCFFLGIIQKTAIDSVFGESGPISTGGGLKRETFKATILC